MNSVKKVKGELLSGQKRTYELIDFLGTFTGDEVAAVLKDVELSPRKAVSCAPGVARGQHPVVAAMQEQDGPVQGGQLPGKVSTHAAWADFAAHPGLRGFEGREVISVRDAQPGTGICDELVSDTIWLVDGYTKGQAQEAGVHLKGLPRCQGEPGDPASGKGQRV